jgi:hypothetical protein
VYVVLLHTNDRCFLWARCELALLGTAGKAHSTATLWCLGVLKLLGKALTATFVKRAAGHALPLLLLATLCLAGCWISM